MVPIKEAHSWVRGVRKERQRCVCGGRGHAWRRRQYFSMTWILCLCYSLCAGCVRGDFSQRHNEVQTKRRVFYHNYTFHLPAAALNVPRWPAMHTRHSFFRDSCTDPLRRRPRLGCMALIDSWLSIVPLYLFQSLPFTFAGLLIIYLDMLPVNAYKSAVLGSWRQMNGNQAQHEGSPHGQKAPDQKILQRSLGFAEHCSQLANLISFFWKYRWDAT